MMDNYVYEVIGSRERARYALTVVRCGWAPSKHDPVLKTEATWTMTTSAMFPRVAVFSVEFEHGSDAAAAVINFIRENNLTVVFPKEFAAKEVPE